MRQELDFGAIYREFGGRMGPTDCWERCKGGYRCCGGRRLCPLVPEEGVFLASRGLEVVWDGAVGYEAYVCRGRETCPGELRPVICRLFPLAPGDGGLVGHKGCSELGAMSREFVGGCERVLERLLAAGGEVAAWVWEMQRMAAGSGNYVRLTVRVQGVG